MMQDTTMLISTSNAKPPNTKPKIRFICWLSFSSCCFICERFRYEIIQIQVKVHVKLNSKKAKAQTTQNYLVYIVYFIGGRHRALWNNQVRISKQSHCLKAGLKNCFLRKNAELRFYFMSRLDDVFNSFVSCYCCVNITVDYFAGVAEKQTETAERLFEQFVARSSITWFSDSVRL